MKCCHGNAFVRELQAGSDFQNNLTDDYSELCYFILLDSKFYMCSSVRINFLDMFENIK